MNRNTSKDYYNCRVYNKLFSDLYYFVQIVPKAQIYGPTQAL